MNNTKQTKVKIKKDDPPPRLYRHRSVKMHINILLNGTLLKELLLIFLRYICVISYHQLILSISLVEKVEGSENALKKESSKFEFLSDVAMLHSNAAQRLKMRMSIMSSIGPHRRALCARKDLSIRRYLCKVSKVGWFSQDYQKKG